LDGAGEKEAGEELGDGMVLTEPEPTLPIPAPSVAPPTAEVFATGGTTADPAPTPPRGK